MPKIYLEPEEITRLEEEAEYLRDKLLVRILARTGCRISEALSLKPSDIDFDRGLITIKHLKVRAKLTCPSCGSRLAKKARFCPSCGTMVTEIVSKAEEQQRVRTIPIDDETLDIIKEYIERGGVRNETLLGIKPSRAWQIIHELAERAGLPSMVHPETGKRHGVSPHRLRDAFAIHAVKQMTPEIP